MKPIPEWILNWAAKGYGDRAGKDTATGPNFSGGNHR